MIIRGDINMRKLSIILFLIIIFALLISCTSLASDNYETPVESNVVSIKSVKDYMATVEDSDETAPFWIVSEDKDRFGNPTGTKSVACIIPDGKFSNSATTDSELVVGLYPYEDDLVFRFLEYGSYLADFSTGSVASVYSNIGGQETKHKKVSAHRSAISISGKDAIAIATELAAGNDVSMYIVAGKYIYSTYKFTIPAKGFVNAYKQIYNK